MSSIKYQPHIDGLRALAVLSVFIFHLEGSYLPGGFLGVDIFFVISGYLITSIIYKEKLADQFLFKTFYIRRCKRILPPLFLVLLFTLIVGYKILLPYDFYKLAISMLSVVSFSANVQYSMRAGDYFSGDSSEWPLLHTWSLAVEEQYYFVFPALLFLLIVKLPRHLNLILLGILILSFSIAEFMSRTPGLQSFSYYLIITRMGELLVGSLLALMQAQGIIKRSSSSMITSIALLGIFALFFQIDEQTVFPGYIALLLCLLTAILINSKSSVTRLLLENKLIIFVGLISYSLYLFHWPVLAFARYLFNIESHKIPLPEYMQVLSVATVFLLSISSYYLIEQPLRRKTTTGKQTALFYFAIPTILVCTISVLTLSANGYPERLDSKGVLAKYQFNHLDKDECPALMQLGCVGGKQDGESLALFYGNSHGEHYFKFVSDVSREFGFKVKLYAKGGCSLMASSFACNSVRNEFLHALDNEQPKAVLLAFRWDLETRKNETLLELQSLIQQAKLKTERVIVFAQPPLLAVNPAKIANCDRLNLDCGYEVTFTNLYPTYNEKVKEAVLSSGAEFFDPFDFVEDRMTYKKDGRYYYYDRDHLSLYGNAWLANSYLTQNSSGFLR